MDEIVELIRSVGFPIVAFLLMYYQNTTIQKEVVKTLNENTITLKQLQTIIEGKRC